MRTINQQTAKASALFFIFLQPISGSFSGAQLQIGPSERTDPIAQGPGGEKPPPPDDPNENDVAKRRRFIHEMNHQRINFGCFQYADMLKEAGKEIPEEQKENLLQRSSTMLVDDLGFPVPLMVRWFGKFGGYVKQGGSGGIEQRLELLLAEWPADDLTIRASQLVDSTYLRLQIGFPKRPALRFRPMPAGFSDNPRDWEYVSKAEVRKLMEELFGEPYSSNVLFDINGSVTNCAGVDVFRGNIRVARKVNPEGGDEPSNFERVTWKVPDRILITDSDPQYVCLSFDLGEAAKDQSHVP